MAMDWSSFRTHFPITSRWAYFDHAAVAPVSKPAQQAMLAWAADMVENGDVHEGQWVRRVEQVRRLAGQLINADPLDIAFVKNTSEGIGIVAEGLAWRDGDNVVTAAEEYPSNLYPWLNLVQRGVEVRMVPSRDRKVCIEDIRKAIDARTRLVSLSFVEFASGYRNNLDDIAALCRERGIYFFVDAIQGLGVMPLDVQKTLVDFLSSDGHKWLVGPEGAGIFYIRRNLVDLLHPIGVGWNSVVRSRDFGKIDFELKPHAGRWESGSLNVAGITALGASLELLLSIGISAVSERVLALTQHFCDKSLQAGFDVYSVRSAGERSGIVSVIVDGSLPELVKLCRERGIIVNKRAGRLRVSPHFYNTHEELDRLIDLMVDFQTNPAMA
jgi:selenocysteine lyase/cysteine desulfurase